MSQMSGVAGDGFAVQPPKAVSSGRAVLLLAIAVVVGVVLLHELDNSPVATSATAAKHEAAATNPAPAANPAPAVAPQVRTPSEVSVLVANGTTVNGAANKVAGRLQPIGYKLLKPGNTTTQTATSIVQYTPGYQAEAQALATSLGVASTAVQQMPNPAPIADLQGANVLVIIGNELAGQPAAGGATPAAGAPAAGQTSANGVSNGPLNATPNNNSTGNNSSTQSNSQTASH